MRVLVVGATGMIGHSVFKAFDRDPDFEAWGTSRRVDGLPGFVSRGGERWLPGVQIMDPICMIRVFERVRPDVVINAIGVVKQLEAANDPLMAIPINGLLPHRLALACKMVGARLVQISTDCVFLGSKGSYTEKDCPDAEDLYGRSKAIGEIADQDHVVTLRTSTVGHEDGSSHGLLEWFLRQDGVVNGFSQAVFSGLPTIELASVIKDIVCPLENLHGLYNVAGDPINKFDFLKLVAEVYGKEILIRRQDEPVIDRSLNSDRFHAATGYQSDNWAELIGRMYMHHRQEREI